MAMDRSDDGCWYGSIEVLLTRVVKNRTETLIGTSSPFGGVMVAKKFEGKTYTEQPHSYWIAKGFTITEPEILHEARRAFRVKRGW